MKWLIFLCFIFPVKAKIPNINLLDGKEVKFDSKKDKVFLFMSQKCPCSNGHYEHIADLQKRNPEIQFIGIHTSLKIPQKKIINHYKSKGLSFPLIQDNGFYWSDKFKAVKTPHSYLVGKNGDVLYQGGVTNSRNPKRAKKFYLKTVLNDLKNQKTLTYTESKTLGCRITR